MEKVKFLIEKIKKCDLSKKDKQILIEKLEKEKPDINGFLKSFYLVCKVSKEILKLLDID